MKPTSKNRKSRALASCLRCRKVLGNVIGHARWCGVKSRYDPERFWAKVDKSGGPDACWPYTGYITPEGYGWAYTGLPTGQQQTHGAHRQAWINTYGPIPGDLQVCHHCDNPPCCNPKHLFTGTNNDNTLDMLRKERHRRKLSAAQVREIIPLKGTEQADDVGRRIRCMRRHYRRNLGWTLMAASTAAGSAGSDEGLSEREKGTATAAA